MLWVQAHLLSFYTDVIRMCVCVCILCKCFYLKCVYGVDPLSHALRRDGRGFPLGSFLVCLSHSLSAPSFHPHSQHRWWFTKSPALPCPAGLPGDHGVVSSPRDLWGVVCANGHGAGHRLQQCARLRPQHWCRHGSERYHWCKWGWRAPANHIRGSVFSLQANHRGSTLCLPANHLTLFGEFSRKKSSHNWEEISYSSSNWPRERYLVWKWPLRELYFINRYTVGKRLWIFGCKILPKVCFMWPKL